MSSIFAYQSSEVDWCESNFQHSELVAEFYNTFSNVFFLIFGPIIMFLMHPYAQKRTWAIYGVSVLFMVIGLFSMYFHMTLSFLGQLLDEISILWLLASGYSVWMPRCYFPKFIKGNRYYFSCLVITTTIISTFLTFVKPTINAYALNSIAIHILYIVHKEYKKTSNGDLRHLIEMSVILWAAALTSWISDRVLCSFWQRIHFSYLHSIWTSNGDLRHLIEMSVILWAAALTSWISDRVLCSFWQRIHFSYLHSIWHVLISITFPYGIVTMALLDAKYEMPGQTLKVHYWPRDSWFIGLPYVEIQDDKNC